jgi:hypothetical protein
MKSAGLCTVFRFFIGMWLSTIPINLAVKAVLWIIRENCNFEGNLSFTEIGDDFVEKQINKINVNKATGFEYNIIFKMTTLVC